ncbi:arylsulfatase G-like [Ischnura elegans]|uniref:arylsulfatase G-like n=1 Tax=Ischnura elegans TaxID=197161 RepID=UPI001ED8740F|nr:arylsulfatase G-like [Ischnura elegans]
MNYISIIHFLFLGVLLHLTSGRGDGHTTSSETESNANIRNPNIVLLVADDMGWGDLGANWLWVPSTVNSFLHSKARTATPNMDNLAMEGLRFTDFHAAASVCAPSRAALLTSRLGLRTGVFQNFGVDAVGGLPSNETTIAKMLLDAGYRTAMFGKWHLGLSEGHHPLDHGFQSYLGVPYSVDMGCTNPPGLNIPQCSCCSHANDIPKWESVSQCRDDVALPLVGNHSIIHQPVKLEELSALYAAFAKDFIFNSDDNGPPFFLYGAFSHVHVPLLTANGTNNKDTVYKEALNEIDDIVGQIATAVKTMSTINISKFSARETLIWFLSDNGPWEVKCQLSGSWGPFSGNWQRNPSKGGGGGASKQTVWEGGHRVPSFIYWPPRVKGGRVSKELLSALDIMPTLASITGAKLPNNRLFDGKDITDVILSHVYNEPLYFGNDSSSYSRILFHPNSGASGNDGDIGAVRVGNYKAVFFSGGAPDCSGYFPPRANHTKEPLIFDLSSDPEEGDPLPSKSEVYNLVKRIANDALQLFLDSLKSDNLSSTTYVTNPAFRPCCSRGSLVCRCPWD